MAQKQTPMQAMDTFVATMPDGSDQVVTKGQILPFGHELVRRDRDGSGTLFRPFDMGGDDEADGAPAKSAAPAEASPSPVKPAAVKGPGRG